MAERDVGSEVADISRRPPGREATGEGDERIAVGLVVQLDAQADGLGCGWWQTDASDSIAGLVGVGSSWPSTLVSIMEVLRDGADPEVVVGAAGATAAFAVAWEWIDAGIEPSDVVGWLRAGCWKPTVARAMADAGVCPWHLLDEDGRPQQWVDVPTPDGEQLPLARAVAEEFETVETAARMVARRAS